MKQPRKLDAIVERGKVYMDNAVELVILRHEVEELKRQGTYSIVKAENIAIKARERAIKEHYQQMAVQAQAQALMAIPNPTEQLERLRGATPPFASCLGSQLGQLGQQYGQVAGLQGIQAAQDMSAGSIHQLPKREI